MISSFREASSLPLPSLVQALPPDGRGRLKRTHTRPESAMSGQTGAANGRAGGHASGSARRKRALDRAPRVRVLSETPTTKRKRHQDAVETSEQDLSPPGVDTGLLTSVTTTVVMSIIDDMQLSPQSKRQCTVLMSTAAASVGAAMWPTAPCGPLGRLPSRRVGTPFCQSY